VLNTTFTNILVISWRSVLLVHLKVLVQIDVMVILMKRKINLGSNVQLPLKWVWSDYKSKYYVSFYKGYKKGRAHSTDDGIQVEIKNGSKVVSRCHSCNTPSNNWHGVSARKANDVLAYYLSARHTICQLSIQNCQHEKSLKMAERTFCSIVTTVNKY
jgi:hypothetical protein